VALIGLDPKRVELNLWRDRFSVIAKKEEDATTVLAATVEEMERRYEWLEEKGLKKITEKEISPTMPLLVLMVDELADLVSIGVTKDEKNAELERSTMIRRLIAKGRAAGVVVITATQKPQSDVIPTAMRDLIQQRVAYATTNAAMTDTILGAGMASNGGLAHNIAASEKGVCYIVNETSREPVRARTFWIADEDVAGVAASTARNRVELPWMPHIGGKPTATPVEAPTPITAGADGEKPARIALPKPDQRVFNVWDSQYSPSSAPSAPSAPVNGVTVAPENLFSPPRDADAVEVVERALTPLEREMERRNALLDEIAAMYPEGADIPVFEAPEVELLQPEPPRAQQKKTAAEPPKIQWQLPPELGGEGR
jgi:DNA segregation ATPase FtsK/SpoIIIE-like protein